MLEVKNLKVYYYGDKGIVRAVDGVSFELEKGEALGIVGESGSGKSTLARAIVRDPELWKNAEVEGNILLDGAEILNMTEKEFKKKFRWKKISMVFQGAMNSLNPIYRIKDQIADMEGVEKLSALQRAKEIFKDIGLAEEVMNKYPHELSGGMKQRVVIAQALILDPDLVIMDEPTSALDVTTQAEIIEVLKQLKKLKKSFIFITHDIQLAGEICDILAVMYAGQIVEIGKKERVFKEPKHPYTQKLLASVPELSSRKIPESIPGSPPDLTNPPSGCRVNPRCPFIFEKCGEEPPLIQIGEQKAKCWLNEE